MENIPLWLCIPFAGLLLCIAIFPLVKGEWWDKNKGWAVLLWSLLFVIPFAVKYGAGETAGPDYLVTVCRTQDLETILIEDRENKMAQERKRHLQNKPVKEHHWKYA